MKHFTFKKSPASTGLAAIGERPSGEIKLLGRCCGWYTQNAERKFEVWFHKVDTASGGGFKNIRMTARFESEASCREWLKANTEGILQKIELYFLDKE